MASMIVAVDRCLARMERALAIALTGALTAIMMAQVVLRYFLNAPLFWAEEVSVQLLVFITLLGLSLLVHQRQLVSIDLLQGLLPQRLARWLDGLMAVLLLVLLACLAWLGWQWVGRADVRMELGATIRLPRWYSYSVFPFAFALMAWHQLAHVLRRLGLLAQAAPREPA